MGGSLGSVPEVYNKLSMVDKAYIIIDHDRKHGGAKQAAAFFEQCNVDYGIIIVDGKRDFRGIIDEIRKIAERHKNDKNVRYSIDMTGGTSLMSSALCYASFFIGAETYYVMYDKSKDHRNQLPLEDRIVKLPTANVPDIKNFSDKTRKVLNKIYEYYDQQPKDSVEPLSETRLLRDSGMSGYPALGHHLKILKASGIIIAREVNGNRSRKEIIVTEDGKMIKGWLDII